MAKKKHKPGKFQQNKIARAHHKNVFINKIKRFIDLAGGKDTSKLIPDFTYEKIYLVRLHSLRPVSMLPDDAPKTIIHDIKLFLSPLLRNTFITILNEQQVNLEDFIDAGISCSVFLSNLKDTEFKDARELKRRTHEFVKNSEEYFKLASERLLDTFLVFCGIHSNLESRMYFVQHKFGINQELKQAENLVEVYCHIPERRNFIIDEVNRPAVRVCYGAGPGLQCSAVKPSELGYKGSFGNLPLDVYIQMHALHRLNERIDCIVQGLIHFFMLLSLNEPAGFTDSHGKMFIELRILKYKTGYFVADLKDGVVLIRTFLFVTQSGTPEGNKLEEICGLNRYDKEYLALDKLSSFITSDFKDKKELETLFTQSGCEQVLQFKDVLGPICHPETKQSTADLLIKYLGLEKNVFDDLIQEE